MARIPLLDENDPSLQENAQRALADARATRGTVLNLHRALANRPEALDSFMDLIATSYRARSTLQPKHGEFAYLTASAVNNCFY